MYITDTNFNIMINTIKNSVQLTGNIGKEVNLISFDNGNKKATLVLATNESFTNTKGEKVKNTTWHLSLIHILQLIIRYITYHY